MADRAQVTSTEAIESFRSALIVYLSKVRPALEEMANEVVRAKQWLQNDQRRLWEGEMKMRAKKLERAKAELFSVSLSRMQEVSAAQQLLVQRAELACDEALKKLAMLKKWGHELDNRADPLVKQVDQFQSFVTTELPRAIAYLGEIIKTLEAYADVPMSGLPNSGAMPGVPELPPENPSSGNVEEKKS
jgi:hypothetical protein